MKTSEITPSRHPVWEMGVSAIKELEADNGILASGRNEAYGCIFGRDSLITALTILSVYEKTKDENLRLLVRKILLNLCMLQGSEENIESGEEPGKCIHEFRPEGHEHLTRDLPEPWFVYPDNAMRNYDTVDATPLFLIALFEYIRVAPYDGEFAMLVLPHAERALEWVLNYSDKNGDGLVDYQFHPERRHGGLRSQSWMDSSESLFHDDGTPFIYPIAPVEVQGYTFRALKAWAWYFRFRDSGFSAQLAARATELKRVFNERFVVENEQGVSLAFAVDGAQKPMTATRSSMGHILWSAWDDGTKPESILNEEYVQPIVDRLTAPDMFEPAAGFRTLAATSSQFDPMSYHNGSIWPHDTAMVGQGLRAFGYHKEADQVRDALLSVYDHFQTPIELFSHVEGAYKEYCTPTGHKACRVQAWSAAAALAQAS